MERFDVVDKNGKVIGETTRDKAHQDPSLIHPVVHSWIFNSKGQVLAQQRSMQKKIHPGLWDLSVGGHIEKGDSHQDTLARELQEELGITDFSADLLEEYIYEKENETEYVYLYLVTLDDENQQFTLQTEEVERVEWFDLSDLYTRTIDGLIKAAPSIKLSLPKVLQHFVASSFT